MIQIRGPTALVLEESYIHALGTVVEASTLKEHGVDMFCTPDMDASCVDGGILHVVYLVHARIESVYDAATHAAMLLKHERQQVCRSLDSCDTSKAMKVYVVTISRHLDMARRVFEEKNLLGDAVFLEIPYMWMPAGPNVVSLESPGFLKDVLVEKNMSALYEVAHGLYQYQSMFGSAVRIQAMGAWSCRIADIVKRMRKEAGTNVPAISDHGLDEIILIDRTVDMVTPMCMQLTYEGLLDELLGLEHGQIRDQGRKTTGLDDTDPIFRETRDKLFSGARIWIHGTLKEIQKFRDVDMADADVASLKGFVSNLREKFSRMHLHTSLLEKLGEEMKRPSFIARQKIEAEILDDGIHLHELYERMYKGDDVYSVLRLMCLYCAARGGIPKKDFDVLRKDLFNTYGFHLIATVYALQEANILYPRKDDRKQRVFSEAKAQMNLLVQDGRTIDEENPQDIHYAYAGYAPYSSRLIEDACTKGWKTDREASCPTVVVQQDLDDDGYAKDEDIHHAERLTRDARTTLVVFVGGVTHAELSTLRFLSKKDRIPRNSVIATTTLLNGTTMIKSLIHS